MHYPFVLIYQQTGQIKLQNKRLKVGQLVEVGVAIAPQTQ
jgi:hypothetical protein